MNGLNACAMIFNVTQDQKYLKLVDVISDYEMKKLKEYFHRKAVDFFFDPRYKNGTWDGFDDFFHDGHVAIGLWKELRNFLQTNGYPLALTGLEKMFNLRLQREEFDEFVSDVLAGTDMTDLRWFQAPCAFNILKYRYCMAELATSAGKTLISFLVAAYLKKTGEIDKDNKFLMIVPRSDLVGQTADKFEKVYSNGTVPLNVVRMGGKFSPHTKKAKAAIEQADVIIATYQTLANCSDDFFWKVRHVNVDEAHTTTNATIRAILRKCPYLKHRFGLSGTIELNTGSADYCRLQEYLGPCVMIVTAKDLIDSEYSPNIYIKAVKLEYDELGDKVIRDYCELLENGREMYVSADEFGKAMYNLERQIITSHPARLEFIVSLVKGLKMNTLILFNDVKGKYGRTIYDKLTERGERAYYIDGGVGSNDREDYTHAIEKYNDVKLIASFGTFSTGIDIKNVYNIIFVESYKSPILIRQSIGRGMRELAGKYAVNIIDIIDTFGKYSTKHYKERRTIYKDQQFPVTEHKYDLVPIYNRIAQSH